MNPAMPQASAVAIDKGKIILVGDEESILSEFKDKGKLINLDGAAVIPGLCDAHIHLANYSLNFKKVECETPIRAEFYENIHNRAKISQPDKWILGHGWNHNNWIEGYGNANDLDTVAPANPVFASAKSMHAAWVNTKALQLAGINKDTPNPPDGHIQRDKNGIPTGILLEGAMELVERIIPQPAPQELAEMIQSALEHLSSLGLTSLHDFDQRSCFTALQILHSNGQLNTRLLKSIPLDDIQSAINLGIRTGFGDDMLRIGNVKIFADGALGPKTAAMRQPYQNDPENSGILLKREDEIFEIGNQAAQHGLALAVHAIGDRAVHEVLNAFQQLPQKEKSLRQRIEHVQIIQPDDAVRLAQLGIIASMQPIHVCSDMEMADQHWGERAANSYAWRYPLDNGATLVFGSDAPVDSPNPFLGLHAALTRRRVDGFPEPDGWYPDQKLNMYEALHAYTIAPAFAAGMENRLGILAPGYHADLLVLDVDPFTCHPDQLLETTPVRTMTAGKWVHGEH